MKSALAFLLAVTACRLGLAAPLNPTLVDRDVNATLVDRTTYDPDAIWHDATGPISKGYFSMYFHSGIISFFSEYGSDWYMFALTSTPCSLPDVPNYPHPGWKNVGKSDPNIKLHHPIWIHPGNQCDSDPPKEKGEQLDNTWIWYGPALAPRTSQINVISDNRCQSVSYLTSDDWRVPYLAYRCILPMYDKGEGPHSF